MSNLRYLFMMGIFRSGTSLLSTSLNTHKNIIIGWQPYMLFFKACRNKFFKEVLKRSFDADYPMGIQFFISGKERGLFRDIFNLVKFDSAELTSVISQVKAYLSCEEKNINKNMKPYKTLNYLDNLEPGTAGHILYQLMERLYLSEINTRGLHKEDVNIVGIKEIFCDEYIEPILNYEGLDSVVLHIIRDPRAVVASRNYGKYKETIGSRYPIYFIIRTWKRTMANYILNKDKKCYLMIKYEELVKQPEQILKKVCSVLGVEFSEDILDFNKYTDSKGNKWEPNSSFETYKIVNTSPVYKWKDVLSYDEIEVIEYFCQSELEYMGYEIMTDYFDIEKINNYKEDMTQVNDWLRKYDFSFKTDESISDSIPSP